MNFKNTKNGKLITVQQKISLALILFNIFNVTASSYAHACTITSGFYKDVTFPEGKVDIQLSFKLSVQGEGTADL